MYLLGKEIANLAKQSIYICSREERKKCPKVLLFDKLSDLVPLMHFLMYPCSPQLFPSMQFCYLLELSLKTNIINSCQLVSASDYWRWNLRHQSQGKKLFGNTGKICA